MANIKKALPVIFAVSSAVAIVASNIITAKVTVKAVRELDKKEEELGRKLTKKEKIDISAPIYAPAYISGIAGILAITVSSVMSENQKNKIADILFRTQEKLHHQVNATEKIFGTDAAMEVRKVIAEDNLFIPDYERKCLHDSIKDKAENPEAKLFYMEELYFSADNSNYDGYFTTDEITFKKAMKMLNSALENVGECSLNWFLGNLGLPAVKDGDIITWSIIYGYDRVHYDLQTFTYDDGLECTIVYLDHSPDYDMM